MTDGRRALLCLVTDRRRLCASLGHSPSDWRAALHDQIRGAVSGGIDLVQIREPDLSSGALVELVRLTVPLTAGTTARVIVNDRVDVAIAAGAAGVHLREDGLPASQARRLGPAGFMVGRSIHGADGAVDAPVVDYLIAGTVFRTPSKGGEQPLLGLAGLARAVERAGSTPVLAIGGITAACAHAVARAGASGVAGIGVFIPDEGALVLSDVVEKMVRNLRFAFDSASAVP